MIERIPDLIQKIASPYLRVSTEDQRREGHSLEFQLEDCYRIIEQNPTWIRGPIYQDVESGFEIERPGYQQMLRDAQAGKFQVLVVWKLDRFTRNTLEGLKAVEFLVSLGIEIVSPTEYFDFQSARGKRNFREDLVSAEYERDKLIERVMPGMKRGVAKGNYQGARYPRYGYFYDKKEKLLVEVPKEVEVVKIIFSLRASGMAIYSIALRLADMGIRNRVGRLFTTRQIIIILNRAFYVDGHLDWNGIRSAQPVCTPIIDKETWEKAQAVNRDRYIENKSVSPGRVTSIYVLQGVLKCIYCGGNMVGQLRISNRAKGVKIPWYLCGQYVSRTSRACKGQCVRGDAVHELAFEILRKVLQNPQLIQLTREHLRKLLEYSFPHLSRRVHEIRSILQRLKKDEAKCREAYYAEAQTVEQFKLENHRILKEQQAVEDELKAIEAKLSGAVAYQGKVDQVFGLLNDFEPIWSKMAPVQQRVIYRGIFDFFYVQSRKYSREYQIKDFSLKEPFKSWYHGRIWEGPLVIAEAGNVLALHNIKEGKDLCSKYLFAPSGAK